MVGAQGAASLTHFNFFVVHGIELRASHMVAKCSAT